MIESRPAVIFNVEDEDLIKHYGWNWKEIKDQDEIKIECKFPLECEVVFDEETEKTYLKVTLIERDPNSDNIYNIDFFDVAKDLVSMGYLDENNYDKFIDHVVTNSPNRETLNYLDNTGTTIRGYSGLFKLDKCLEQQGDTCVIVTDSATNEVFAEIPVEPINELEFAIRQRNIKFEKESTDAGVSVVSNSGINCLFILATMLGPVLYLRFKVDKRYERIAARKRQEELDNHNRGIEASISELEEKIKELEEEKV